MVPCYIHSKYGYWTRTIALAVHLFLLGHLYLAACYRKYIWAAGPEKVMGEENRIVGLEAAKHHKEGDGMDMRKL